MAGCQRYELLALAVEEWIGRDDERAGMQFDEGGESGIDLAFGAGLQDMELHPLRARRFPHVSYDALGTGIVRVYEQGDHLGPGQMSPTPASTLVNLQQTINDLQQQLAGAKAERDEFKAARDEALAQQAAAAG